MLVERYLPLARQLANRYRSPHEPFDDLFQVAALGLIKAIDRFELDRGIAFSSFAVPTVLGELKRYFRDRTWSVRVPRDLQELSLRVDHATSDLTLELQRQPTVPEISARVDASRRCSKRSMPVAPTARSRLTRPAAPTTTPAPRSATRSRSRTPTCAAQRIALPSRS
jgi:RNA polymerase sigma-B factor